MNLSTSYIYFNKPKCGFHHDLILNKGYNNVLNTKGSKYLVEIYVYDCLTFYCLPIGRGNINGFREKCWP